MTSPSGFAYWILCSLQLDTAYSLLFSVLVVHRNEQRERWRGGGGAGGCDV